MNRIAIDVQNIVQVNQFYNRILVYRADTEAGPFTEITDATTRMVINVGRVQYYFVDPAGTPGQWYCSSYLNVDTSAESEQSTPFQAGTSVGKVGYSFNNYSPPPGEWGRVLTAADLRYSYLWGVDVIASDSNNTEWMDEQFDFILDLSVAEFERYLNIDIVRRKYKTSPLDSEVRARRWVEGVDYTDLEMPYDFDPNHWANYGFIQLRHCPVIKVNRAVMYNMIKGELINLLDKQWVRVEKEVGQLRLFPTQGQPYGPFAVQTLPYTTMGGGYPDGYEIDYETGYQNSDYVPDDLRDVIGKLACIQLLDTIGDGILAGFSSMSISLDGLSESFSSTQSATSGYFGPRQMSFKKDIQDWLQRNRYKFGAVPMGFVGAK